MNLLLKVLATLPVTTTSVERSFSIMKRIKTLPRSVMGHDRLSALAMMSIHWDTVVDRRKYSTAWQRKNQESYFFKVYVREKINTDMNFAISRYFLLNIKNA
ncbi:hypothetical protein TNCT_658691 [Trichonephila clavata]|uniref:HAT C-terminal dimerisation domain-containing protein n=1 Tax=Trichonephila clavata TaxID=2740835 RepID=A0A8X6G2V5_TRICU|nr:hypothetical protein TNCT_658691 [Trichonephila clavata]